MATIINVMRCSIPPGLRSNSRRLSRTRGGLTARIKRIKYVAGGRMRMFLRKIDGQHIAAIEWQGMHNNAGVMAYNRILERTCLYTETRRCIDERTHPSR